MLQEYASDFGSTFTVTHTFGLVLSVNSFMLRGPFVHNRQLCSTLSVLIQTGPGGCCTHKTEKGDPQRAACNGLVGRPVSVDHNPFSPSQAYQGLVLELGCKLLQVSDCGYWPVQVRRRILHVLTALLEWMEYISLSAMYNLAVLACWPS